MIGEILKVIWHNILFYIIYLMRHFSINRRHWLSWCICVLCLLLPVVYCSQILSQESTELRPNELGSIMVLMYHDIRTPESTWVRTPANLSKDLSILFEKKYQSISLIDFVSGNFNTDKGYTPVVLTFDDGTAGQFRVIGQNGNKIPDPQSAVGILEDFSAAHSAFKPKATFFVNGRNPFKEPTLVSYKLNYLLAHGMEIGNHTSKHQNLGSKEMSSPQAIQSAIGLQSAYLESQLSSFPDYRIRTLALCFGSRPKQPFLQKYLAGGMQNGTPYENIAVLNVGSSPARSPFDKAFNPYSIPRIRASEIKTAGTGLYDWVKYFDKHPDERFVSDGNADTVTIPELLKPRLNTERLSNQQVITY
jgi:Polysaccharide deacetylase